MMTMNSKVFSEGKVSKVLLRFAVPSIISLLLLELYNMVDTIFVGRYIGANAIGALTVAFPIQRLIIALGMLISIGASTYVSRSLGEKNLSDLKQTIMNAFIATAAVLAFVTITIYIFRNPIIRGLGASENIFPYAKAYISIILLGSIFQCLGVVAGYIMIALGNTKITLYSNLMGAAANVAVNYLLIVILGFGIEGAAIATVFSQIAACIYALYKFREVKKSFGITFSTDNMKKAVSTDILFGIAAVGFSTFIIEISDAVVAVILNNLLVSRGGDSAIIIVGVITKVSMFMFITIIGISSAMQPIVAYNYGAKNYAKMKKALKVSLITVAGASISFWLVFMIFAKGIIGFFLKDAAILGNAVAAFRLCILVLPVISIYYITIYYYQAIGESRRSFLLSIYRQLVIFIPTALLFVQWFGIAGAWIAYPVSDIISAVTSVYYIRKANNEDYEQESIAVTIPLTNNILVKTRQSA
jgi:putative MATE family efflux protein